MVRNAGKKCYVQVNYFKHNFSYLKMCDNLANDGILIDKFRRLPNGHVIEMRWKKTSKAI